MYIGGDFYIKEDYLRSVRAHILFTYLYTLYVLHLFVYLFVYLSFYLFIFLLVRILIFFSISFIQNEFLLNLWRTRAETE